MLRIVLFLWRMDYGTMLNIVLFLSFTSGTALARLPQSLAKVPSRLLSETHNKSVIPNLIADHIVVIAQVAAVPLILGTCWWYCRKARRATRIDEESNPGSWVTYPVRDLIVATKNFSDSNLVGEGGFARVYRADLGGNRIGAVKRLLQVDSTLFAEELAILLRVPSHPNLVNPLGMCSDLGAGYQMIVFEYVANGTLFSRLHENQGVAGPLSRASRKKIARHENQGVAGLLSWASRKKIARHENQGVAGPLSWASRKKIARQVAEALRHLHEQANPPIIHRDVKSKNVLLENALSVKLADFGIAVLGPKDNRPIDSTPCGTFGYMDPQCLTEHGCSAKIDVYSFGVLLLELITGSKALIGTEALVIRTRTDRLSRDTNNIMKIVDPSLPDRNNRNELLEMIRIANHCLESNRGDRPSMAEVVNMMDRIRNA